MYEYGRKVAIDNCAKGMMTVKTLANALYYMGYRYSDDEVKKLVKDKKNEIEANVNK